MKKIVYLFSILPLLGSCQKDFPIIVSEGDPIELSVSASYVELDQSLFSSNAFTFSWTRGTNQGTGSSIRYLLEVDQDGNDFSDPVRFDMGFGVYELNFNHTQMNSFVLDSFKLSPGVEISLKARIIAQVQHPDIPDDISEVKVFTVSCYDKLPEHLFMLGSAIPSYSGIEDAISMEQSITLPWLYSYTGPLDSGDFYLSLSQDDCYCQGFYGASSLDESRMQYAQTNTSILQWNIATAGNYEITANLSDQTLEIFKYTGPKWDAIYLVGDASPSGWDILMPQALIQDSENPYIFTFSGILTAGELKFSTFQGDWCEGEWLNASSADQVLTATDFIVTQGCDGPDNKWRVTSETQGTYTITIDLFSNTINFEKVG